MMPTNFEEKPKNTAVTKLPEPPSRCPRCDSSNTKFCYYNNYSLSQPRHFCKSCRRYWTRGGALRNVPIGGSSRSRKRFKRGISNSSSSTASNPYDQIEQYSFLDASFVSNPNPSGVLSFNGFTNPSPSVILHNHEGNTALVSLDSCSDQSGALFAPYIPQTPEFKDRVLREHSNNTTLSVSYNYQNLTSTIECMNSPNQNLHWRLQQQRMTMLLDTLNQEPVFINPNDQNHQAAPSTFYYPRKTDVSCPGEEVVASPNRECLVMKDKHISCD